MGDFYCSTCQGYMPLVEADGTTCCSGCGTVVDFTSFSNDVTFTKGAGGEALLVGQYVDGAGLGRSAGRVHGGRHYASGQESGERAIARGRAECQRIADQLGIPARSDAVEAATRVYRIALSRGFTRGRRAEWVAAAAVYVACREAQLPLLLIDFADLLQTNLFTLGGVFLALVRALGLDASASSALRRPVDPSLYLGRFAERLLGVEGAGERASLAAAVARTALRLVASMKRDWIVTGRRPAGVCGAALLVAAAAHGVPKTRREVVRIVHVGELTLARRLSEFASTDAASLPASGLAGALRDRDARDGLAPAHRLAGVHAGPLGLLGGPRARGDPGGAAGDDEDEERERERQEEAEAREMLAKAHQAAQWNGGEAEMGADMGGMLENGLEDDRAIAQYASYYGRSDAADGSGARATLHGDATGGAGTALGDPAATGPASGSAACPLSLPPPSSIASSAMVVAPAAGAPVELFPGGPRLPPAPAFVSLAPSAPTAGGCEHVRARQRAHFAHGMCMECYGAFVQASGGLGSGADPPAFRRAREAERDEAQRRQRRALRRLRRKERKMAAKERARNAGEGETTATVTQPPLLLLEGAAPEQSNGEATAQGGVGGDGNAHRELTLTTGDGTTNAAAPLSSPRSPSRPSASSSSSGLSSSSSSDLSCSDSEGASSPGAAPSAPSAPGSRISRAQARRIAREMRAALHRPAGARGWDEEPGSGEAGAAAPGQAGALGVAAPPLAPDADTAAREVDEAMARPEIQAYVTDLRGRGKAVEARAPGDVDERDGERGASGRRADDDDAAAAAAGTGAGAGAGTPLLPPPPADPLAALLGAPGPAGRGSIAALPAAAPEDPLSGVLASAEARKRRQRPESAPRPTFVRAPPLAVALPERKKKPPPPDAPTPAEGTSAADGSGATGEGPGSGGGADGSALVALPAPAPPEPEVAETLSDISDDDIDCYIADEAEVRVKARIWDMMNGAWVEEQAKKKEAARQRAEEAARLGGGAGGRAGETDPRKPPTRRPGRAAGGRAAAAAADAALGPAATPLEAAQRAMASRPVSTKLNYDNLGMLFASGKKKSAGSRSGPDHRTADPQARPSGRPRVQLGGGGGGGGGAFRAPAAPAKISLPSAGAGKVSLPSAGATGRLGGGAGSLGGGLRGLGGAGGLGGLKGLGALKGLRPVKKPKT